MHLTYLYLLRRLLGQKQKKKKRSAGINRIHSTSVRGAILRRLRLSLIPSELQSERIYLNGYNNGEHVSNSKAIKIRTIFLYDFLDYMLLRSRHTSAIHQSTGVGEIICAHFSCAYRALSQCEPKWNVNSNPEQQHTQSITGTADAHRAQSTSTLLRISHFSHEQSVRFKFIQWFAGPHGATLLYLLIELSALVEPCVFMIMAIILFLSVNLDLRLRSWHHIYWTLSHSICCSSIPFIILSEIDSIEFICELLMCACYL